MRPTCTAAAAVRRNAYPFCGRSGLQLPPISFGLWQNSTDSRGAPKEFTLVIEPLGLSN